MGEVYQGVIIYFAHFVLMKRWMFSECMLLMSLIVCLCVLVDEMGYFGFWSFYIDFDIMRVYVGADGHMSSRLGGFFFFFGRSVVGSLVVFSFAILR
jgi:hypothetical protein